MSRFTEAVLPPAATFVATTLVAELAIRAAGVSPLLLPAPSAVARAAVRHAPTLWPALATTAQAVAIGLALSTVVGLVAAIALASSRWVERAFYPYAIFFQIVPIVAIAPLLVIWFGYGIRAVIAAAFIVSVFPVIANTLAGLRSVDPALRDLFRLYGASGWARLTKLSLPWALPNVLTGLRVAAGLAVIGAIVGEFVGGGGLGVVVLEAMRQQRTDLVFAAVLHAAALGLALFAAVNAVSRLTLRRWHTQEKDA
ncbi:MAG: ABC transporter ATP-binding protein [Proteobacteria bacterium]|nr:MAG: ABC transporter ATP-binding protein [Pseudomonadota bacterium]